MRTVVLAVFFMLVPQVPAPAPQTRDGLIEVVVRDAVSREPIVGARIAFIFQQNPGPNIVTYTTSDENGKAVFKDLVPGNYSLNATRDGYLRPIPPIGPSFVIGPNSQRHQVDLTLTPGATVSGRVLDPNGIPIAEASVTAASVTYREGKRTLVRALTASSQPTDDRGEYRIVGLSPGEYYVQVELRSLTEQGRAGFWDNFPRISYYPGVVDSKVGIPVTIRGPEDLTSIDVKLPSVKTFKVSGKVLNPLPGGRANPNGKTHREVGSYYIGSTDPDSLEDPILIASNSTPSTNPDESIFEIPGVLPGSYYLYPLWDPGTGGIPSWNTSRTTIVVEDHDLEGLNIVLRQNSEIKGRISIIGDASAVPLNGVRLGLRRKERLPTLLGGAGPGTAPVINAATGDFTIQNVANSRFGLTVSGLPQDAYVSDVRQLGRSVFDEGIVADGTDSPVEITINTQGGSVQGTVRNAAGSPAVRAAVVLIPNQRRINPQLYKRATSDPNGQFTIRGIAPGGYKVFAWPTAPPGQAEENSEFLTPFEGRGTALTVAPGSAAALQITVIQQP